MKFESIFAAPTVLPSFLKRDLVYRLHTIRTARAKGGVIATIYDGEKVIKSVQGSSKPNAIFRAKEWIDEQDAYETAFDLHAA